MAMHAGFVPASTLPTQAAAVVPVVEQMLLAQFSDLQSLAAPQAAPSLHRLQFEVYDVAQALAGAQSPPQSGPISVPFFTVSVQVGEVHLPLLHQPVAQSKSLVQALVSGHFVGQVPPQSMSDSEPFCILSVQEGVAHRAVEPLHHWFRQSSLIVQADPSAQGLVARQAGPPQSVAVSPWFCTVSVQVGAAHLFAEQTPLRQSRAAFVQPPPVSHLLQGEVPPQSVPLSF